MQCNTVNHLDPYVLFWPSPLLLNVVGRWVAAKSRAPLHVGTKEGPKEGPISFEHLSPLGMPGLPDHQLVRVSRWTLRGVPGSLLAMVLLDGVLKCPCSQASRQPAGVWSFWQAVKWIWAGVASPPAVPEPSGRLLQAR